MSNNYKFKGKEYSSNLFLEAMETVATRVAKSLFVLNCYTEGIIKAVLTENKYTVQLTNGELYDLPARQGLTLAVNNIVLVVQVNGDINKRFIDCIRPY
jgi:hypothetical protein